MATKAKKMTGKDISTNRLLRAIGDGAKFAQVLASLELPDASERALDGALRREKRAGRVRFYFGQWVLTDAGRTALSVASSVGAEA